MQTLPKAFRPIVGEVPAGRKLTHNRRVTNITTLIGMNGPAIVMQELFGFDPALADA